MKKYVVIFMLFAFLFAFGCSKKETKEPVATPDILKIVTVGKVKDRLVDANVDVTEARTVLREKYGVDNFKAYKILKKAYPNCKVEKVVSFTYKKALKTPNGNLIVLRFKASVAPVTLGINPTVDFVFNKDRKLIAVYVRK